MDSPLDQQVKRDSNKAAQDASYLALNADPSSKPSTERLAAPRTHRKEDRGSSEDNAALGLPVYVRFEDLRRANIVRSWPALKKLTLTRNFPVGQMIGAHTRAWRLDLVLEWLAAQPTANVNARLRHKRAVEEIEESSP